METSTPLRRRSLFTTPIIRRTPGHSQSPIVLLERAEDDETERSKRRSAIAMQRRLTNISNSSPALPEINSFIDENNLKDHLKICTKLYTENKISTKNAWELQIIDIIRKIATTSSDNALQLASSSLDIGAKVYAIRVDDLHAKGLKLASTVTRLDECEEPSGDGDENNADKTVESQNRRKTNQRRKRKFAGGKKNTVEKEAKNLFAPPKMLEPVLFSTKENIEVSATDNLFAYKLHVNSSSQLIMLQEEDKYCVTGDDRTLPTKFEEIDVETFPAALTCTLAMPFNDFEIGTWNLDEEQKQLTNDTCMNAVVLDENGLPLPELDGSLPDIFENDNNAEPSSDVDENHDEHRLQIHREPLRVIDAIPEENRIETDYGYNVYYRMESGKFIDRIWAGPSHWKVKFIRRSTARFSGATDQKAVKFTRRAKVQEKIDFFETTVDVPIKKVVTKRVPSTVPVEKITLPLPSFTAEEYYKELTELYLKPGVPRPMLNKKRLNGLCKDVEVPNYNYDNPNDSQYCSQNSLCDDNGADVEHNGSFDEQVENGVACENFLDEHLVSAPETVATTQITYALHAKKMDMKKLKTAIWKRLTQRADGSQGDTVEGSMKISLMYKDLPNLLSKDLKKELSFPLAFIALLHLCNENNLMLVEEESNDFKDLIIKKATVEHVLKN